ncbi:HoxN/HupN/NixA family nickel/cobalt transporter [Salinibacterium sp. NG253]|uniref:HoxN/HupN/NixA family nickel/cobalt transporter n=1 Tax=Salinibacterium sp. NG253 TaxID=2792039 RepID=UPI0018CDA5A7|nr:HoxN/HupN/NixA family nickel/cobalt transporter [Salinibacterium sp. NG253]MBH0115789.1 HoxN/HupN/NixA family nickel/cobalt transporter [Salinibacterium sp. NG253]
MSLPSRSATTTRMNRSWGVLGAIVALHVVGFGALVLASAPSATDSSGAASGLAVALGIGLTAYALGVRHAFDADHIAAIDNTTRRLATSPREARGTVGFWFALGHSTIVTVLCVLLMAFGQALETAMAADGSAVQFTTTVYGPTISGVFLLVIAAANIIALTRSHSHGVRGPVTWLLGRFDKAVDRPSRMYVVGLLFGLGLDTATEIWLLVLLGAAALSSTSLWAVLALPILFAAGMTAMDTLQGLMASRVYRPGSRSSRVQRAFSVGMTVVAVTVAVVVGVVQLASAVTASGGTAGVLNWISGAEVSSLGFVLAGLILVGWLVVLAVGRSHGDRTSAFVAPQPMMKEGV